MALYQVAAPAPPAAADINQVVNLLTGITTADLGARLNVATTISASLNGASAASRFVGGIAQGPPSSGTFLTGDWLIDAFWSVLWVCTAGGTPGTWVQVGAGSNGVMIITQSGTGQSLTPRTGRTGFDILILDTPNANTDAIQALLYSVNAYGWVAPYACTVVAEVNASLSGVSGNCAGYVTRNGTPVLFGDDFSRTVQPTLAVAGLVRVAAGDVLQAAVYAENGYVTFTGLLGLDVSIMGN